MFYMKIGKRLTDILFSALLIAVLLLPGLILSAYIRLVTGEKALIWQKRVGKNKELFKMARFRLSGSRISRFFKTKGLDRLPALVNVFMGDMSLVGPAPALPNDYAILLRRNDCGANALRPGLLQVSDDTEYARQIGFVTDMRQIFCGGKHGRL